MPEPTESTYPCDTCKKLGRLDGMMHSTFYVDSQHISVTYYWHTQCETPFEVNVLKRWKAVRDHKALPIASVSIPPTFRIPLESTPSTPSTPTPTHLAELNKALAESRERVAQLEKDLALVESGRAAAERCLREEFKIQTSLANNGTLRINIDWITLANEMAMLKGEPVLDKQGHPTNEIRVNPNEPTFNTPEELEAWRHAATIDFLNSLRRGAFKDLESQPDEILVVKARAYDQWYKVCCDVLASRNIKLKIARNEDFKIEEAARKEERIRLETKKQDKTISRKNATPEEKRLDAAIKLTGSREKALAMIASMDAAAKALMDARKAN